jgi:hypothetical protein
MKAVSGVFRSRADAQHALSQLRSIGLRDDQVTVLTPENTDKGIQSVPTEAAEQPGMGKAIGAVLGGSAGFSGAALVMALIPGVGPITAIGLLGSAVVGLLGQVSAPLPEENLKIQ